MLPTCNFSGSRTSFHSLSCVSLGRHEHAITLALIMSFHTSNLAEVYSITCMWPGWLVYCLYCCLLLHWFVVLLQSTFLCTHLWLRLHLLNLCFFSLLISVLSWVEAKCLFIDEFYFHRLSCIDQLSMSMDWCWSCCVVWL